MVVPYKTGISDRHGGLSLQFHTYSIESDRNQPSFRRKPESIFAFAFGPSLGRGRYGHRHIYPLHPLRTRARCSLPRVGIKCKNKSKNHKMDSVEASRLGRLRHRNDGGFPASGESTTPRKERLYRRACPSLSWGALPFLTGNRSRIDRD